MPEAPEVQRYLQKFAVFVGKRVNISGKYDLEIKEVQAIKRVGKKILFQCLLDDESVKIITMGFGLKGKIMKTNHSAKSVCFVLRSEEEVLSVHDPLNMSQIEEHKSVAEFEKKMWPLDLCTEEGANKDWIAESNTILQKIAKRHKANIATIMLEQDMFCGVGNYIRCDALYLASINPHTVARELPAERIAYLLKCVNKVYMDNTNIAAAGGSHPPKKIYKRETVEGGKKVTCEKIGSRKVYWCPDSQQ